MLHELKHYYLQQMGIVSWIKRSPTQFRLQTQDNLCELAKTVSNCTRCSLYQSRTNTVFARGNSQAKLMIVGEAPGFYEDQQGLPFVGKAGSLLNKMLQSIGYTESDIYIANVLKCRPPNNRDPKEDEIEQCSDYLVQQIAAVKPLLILAVGRFAGQFLLNSKIPLGKMRGDIHKYQNTPVLVSYHPAYLLRNPSDKKKTYQDLQRVKQLITELGNAQRA